MLNTIWQSLKLETPKISITMIDSSAIYQALLPKLKDLEVERKQLMNKVQNLNFVMLALVLIAVGLLYFLFKDAADFKANQLLPYGVGLLVLLGIVFGYQHVILNRFRMQFKSEVITDLVQAISPDLVYEPTQKVPIAKFKASKLFKRTTDRYQGEDFIVGKLDKTTFQLSEIHAQEEHEDHDEDGGSSTSYSTIFKGLFMVADFHKDFQGRTFVLPDKEEKRMGSWFSKKIQKLNFGRGTLIQLEDPDFEKEFKVYTTDVVEARYLLSPNLMRDILLLKDKFSCRIYISFINSNIYLALSTKHDFMEVNFKNSLLDQTTIKTLFEGIWACIGIVEDLNLNTRIWSKQTH